MLSKPYERALRKFVETYPNELDVSKMGIYSILYCGTVLSEAFLIVFHTDGTPEMLFRGPLSYTDLAYDEPAIRTAYYKGLTAVINDTRAISFCSKNGINILKTYGYIFPRKALSYRGYRLGKIAENWKRLVELIPIFKDKALVIRAKRKIAGEVRASLDLRVELCNATDLPKLLKGWSARTNKLIRTPWKNYPIPTEADGQ